MKIKYLKNTLEQPLNIPNIPNLMVSTRQLSGISGPEACQNPISNYNSRANSFHSLAFHNTQLVGYVLATFYSTTPLLFGSKSYVPDIKGDTLMINEIAVMKNQQGNGIASNLLDFTLAQSKCNLSNIEFSILSTNISSETLFTKFAERHGRNITIGAEACTDWGTYFDWTVNLNKSDRKQKLEILNPWLNIFGISWQTFQDRRNLINRSRERQDNRKVGS
ncbi:hypothetical protein HDV06_005912 [Boothiomyces sp. JEL0866]|nr:hypothetical protein HDV06_005912 [Boothiomyces sp. JEL0866]